MVGTYEMDAKLVKKAWECIEGNIGNSSYSVKEFSSDMNMERSGLYRKLVSAIGQTPSEFIRLARLKRAASLLRQRNLQVSEISDQVGFTSAAYFSKCFQKEFNIKPSHYAHIVSETECEQEYKLFILRN